MKETVKTLEDSNIAAVPEHSGPKGIGMAVAFDWGLVVQLLVMPFIVPLLGNFGLFQQSKTSSPMTMLISFLLSLPVAILFAVFGEGIRRGWKWTRPWQIGFNALGTLGGFASLFALWQASKHGDYWLLVTTIILLIFSPLIVWRLSRPETALWFRTVKSVDARKRHGGLWIFFIILWAIAGGVLQAIAATPR